jgi:hypothetical protein
MKNVCTDEAGRRSNPSPLSSPLRPSNPRIRANGEEATSHRSQTTRLSAAFKVVVTP